MRIDTLICLLTSLKATGRTHVRISWFSLIVYKKINGLAGESTVTTSKVKIS